MLLWLADELAVVTGNEEVTFGDDDDDDAADDVDDDVGDDDGDEDNEIECEERFSNWVFVIIKLDGKDDEE